MKHTPEPWITKEQYRAVYDEACYWAEIASNSGSVAYATGDTIQECEANADRIAACVNACAGIDDPAALRKQRDELLDVLRTAVRRVEIANAEGDPILSAWLPTARSAIAAAEPQTDTPA